MSFTGGNKLPKGYEMGQMQNFSPEQMSLFQQLFGHVGQGSNLSRLAGGDQSMFDQMEAPALRQFNEYQGNLASRFSGVGMGVRHSSGFQNKMNTAGSNLIQDLQSRRQELQRQAMQDLFGLGESLLGQRPYTNFPMEKEQSTWQKFLGGSLPMAGGAIGGIFGGPAGAKIGGQIGSSAANAFF